ncbi:MAG: hypothetical protein MNPFHGCM_01713 [Gemmatimonadaceae bacterium]|nr:hypothetical protein [Gemmatimonadaceae bacterium]
MTTKPPPEIPPTDGEDKVRGIVNEFLVEKLREQEAEAAKRRGRKPGPLKLVVLAGMAGAAWFIPLPPQSTTPPIPPAVTEAGARMETFIAAQRVRHYRSQHGVFPSQLSMAGVSAPWLSLSPIDSVNFEVSATVDGVTVRYRSTMPDSVHFRQVRTALAGNTP